MKKALLLLFLLNFSFSFAQKITAESLYGRWKPFSVLMESSKAEAQELTQSLKVAQFELSADGKFNLTSPHTNAAFTTLAEKTKDADWKWMAERQKVVVGKEANQYKSMSFVVVRDGKSTIFYFPDLELQLEMIKI